MSAIVMLVVTVVVVLPVYVPQQQVKLRRISIQWNAPAGSENVLDASDVWLLIAQNAWNPNRAVIEVRCVLSARIDITLPRVAPTTGLHASAGFNRNSVSRFEDHAIVFVRVESGFVDDRFGNRPHFRFFVCRNCVLDAYFR